MIQVAVMEPEQSSDSLAIERFRGYLTVLARVHLGDEPGSRLDASDIVQSTLLEACQKLEQFQGASQAELAGWLRSMLVHNVADALRALRRAKRDIRRERSLEAAIDDSFARADQWLAAEQTSPSQYLDRYEQSLVLADAIARLPSDQGQAVILHHLKGMPLRELAQYMQRSEPAIAGLLFRGLKQLRQMMKPGSP